MELGDEALMRRAQVGDVDAFAELYDRHSARAFHVAQAVCRDKGRAEEAVQEGFLAIWNSRASYQEDIAGFRAWSMRIVHNRAIDSYRMAAIRPPAQRRDVNGDSPQADAGAFSPQDEVIARDERDELLASLRLLPEAQAEVIVLAFFGDLSQSQIATQLDLPTGTVKGRMRLGLEKMRYQMIVARN